jgi:hypothetical protein
MQFKYKWKYADFNSAAPDDLKKVDTYLRYSEVTKMQSFVDGYHMKNALGSQVSRENELLYTFNFP